MDIRKTNYFSLIFISFLASISLGFFIVFICGILKEKQIKEGAGIEANNIKSKDHSRFIIQKHYFNNEIVIILIDQQYNREYIKAGSSGSTYTELNLIRKE